MPAPALKIDLTGLRCPLPVLRTKKALGQIRIGETLIVITTDPAALEDIPAFIHQAGHHLETQHPIENGHLFQILKR